MTVSDPLAPEQVPTPSILDSRGGRLRARAMLGIDWLAVNAFSAAGDPLARVLRGSPRTDVYTAYERIAPRDMASSRLGLRTAVSRQTCDRILRDPRFGVQALEDADATPNRIDLAQGPLTSTTWNSTHRSTRGCGG